MNLLWLTWKDRKNPLAGGAELVNEELAKRLVKNGNNVIFITAGFKDGKKEEVVDGYKIVRLGNRWTVYFQAWRYYKKHLQGWSDLIIDEVNTVPFFAKFYAKEKNIILCYQLCREIWFYQMFFPLSLIGYLIEPLYLWLLRKRIVLTESESTRRDMQKYGFKADNIFIFNIGLEIEPAKDLDALSKYKEPTILSLGTLRSMKRSLHIVKAFEIAKEKIPDLKLVIAGDAKTRYGKKTLDYINNSKYKDSINYLGKVNIDKKIELLQSSHIICATSVKEGWGIIVTEAASQGTSAVVYNVDGLRDSVRDNETGLICQQNTPKNLAKNIINLLENKDKYNTLKFEGWKRSKQFCYNNSYEQFIKIINKI